VGQFQVAGSAQRWVRFKLPLTDPTFPAVEDLIRQAERAAAAEPDRIRLVAELVRLVGERGADPYLLIGALIEGAVHTLAEHVPAERRREVTEELNRLLVDRLRARGLA
jgi:hypothetical protein